MLSLGVEEAARRALRLPRQLSSLQLIHVLTVYHCNFYGQQLLRAATANGSSATRASASAADEVLAAVIVVKAAALLLLLPPLLSLQLLAGLTDNLQKHGSFEFREAPRGPAETFSRKQSSWKRVSKSSASAGVLLRLQYNLGNNGKMEAVLMDYIGV